MTSFHIVTFKKSVHALLFGFLALWLTGFERGDIFDKVQPRGEQKRESYELLRELGSGDSGSVWAVRRVDSNDPVIAMKFYDRTPADQKYFYQHYTVLYKYLSRSFAPNILATGRPFYFNRRSNSSRPAQAILGVSSELMDGSVAARFDEYRWTTKFPKRRLANVRRLKLLMNDAIAGASQYREMELAHFDITKNNIFVKDGRHKLGDSDSVRQLKAVPIDRAWELSTAPPEWGDGISGGRYGDGSIGDLWSIGVVLFELGANISPLAAYHDYLQSVDNEFYGMDFGEFRRLVGSNPNRFTGGFDVFIDGVIDESLIVPDLDKETMAELQPILDFERAILTISVPLRKQRLKQVMANLAVFRKGPGCFTMAKNRSDWWN